MGEKGQGLPPIALILEGKGVSPAVDRNVPALEEALRRQGFAFRLLRTERSGDGSRLVREALAVGERFLVAVGADPLVNAVVNGMIEEDRAIEPDAMLGVLSAGSGCDFVKTFGLPDEIPRAVARLEGGTVYPLDVGKVTAIGEGAEARVRYFVNIAEAGLGAEIAARAKGSGPRGRSAQFRAFWASLLRHRRTTVRVRTGAKEYEGPATNVVVGNCQFWWNGVRLSPRSFPGDSYLDVSVFKGPRSDAFTMLPKMFQGEHVPHPNIEEYRAKTIWVEADRPLRVHVDGVPVGHTPATFEILHRAIQLKV